MQKSNRYFLPLLALMLSAIIVTGCSKGKETVLAKVGGEEITSKDFSDAFDKNQANFASFEDEFNNRRVILDSLVIQRLLVQEAYKKHIDASEEVNRIVLASTDRYLLDILYQREILDKVKITDEDLKDFYNKLEYKYRASHILLSSADSARMIMDSLKNGVSFEKMAVEHSLDRSAKTNQGDLGYFVWGKMDPTFQEQVFKLNTGEVSAPFQTRFGWHIVKMVDKSPNELRQSFERMEPEIRQTLTVMKTQDLIEKYTTALRDKFPVKVDTATCQYILHKRATLYPPQVLATLPKNNFDVNQLDRDEKELVLGTWEGGQITVGQYLSRLRDARGQAIPDFDDYPGLSTFIFQINLQFMLAAEARRLGLEQDSEYKRKLKQFKELAMADIMQNDSLPLPSPADEGQLRQYYDTHPNEFGVPPMIHVYEIMFPTISYAESYKSKVGNLDRFKQMASELTERPGKRASGGDLGYIEQSYYPEIYAAAEGAPVGQVVGPIPVSGKYSLLYVADKKAAEMKDFLTVKTDIQTMMDRENRKKVFSDWVDRMKKEVGVKIYEDNLRLTIDKTKYAAADSTRG